MPEWEHDAVTHSDLLRIFHGTRQTTEDTIVFLLRVMAEIIDIVGEFPLESRRYQWLWACLGTLAIGSVVTDIEMHRKLENLANVQSQLFQ